MDCPSTLVAINDLGAAFGYGFALGATAVLTVLPVRSLLSIFRRL